MGHVFVSYVREDAQEVQRLCDALTLHGIEVWLDRNSIIPGVRWKQAIRKAIREGSFFVACFSKEYNDRDKTYMNEELALAIDELRKRPADRVWFVPVKLSECEIPDRDIGAGETLQDIEWVELYKDWNSSIQRVLKSLGKEIQKTGKEIRENEIFEETIVDFLRQSGYNEVITLLEGVLQCFNPLKEGNVLNEVVSNTGFTMVEVERYRELTLLSAILLLIDQTASGSWGNSIETFAEFYLRTYSTSIKRREGLPTCPKDSPTFQRYAVEALQSVFGQYRLYCPFSYQDLCNYIEERLGDRSRIVRTVPPTGQTGLKGFYIDYHHTTTAAHSFLLSTGELHPYPISVVELLSSHRELWLDLYLSKEIDPEYGQTVVNLAGVHMSDYAYFFSTVIRCLPPDRYTRQKQECLALLNATIDAVIRSQDEKDGAWGYPRHVRPLRKLWVLENISKASPEQFRLYFAPTVAKLCTEQELSRVPLIDQKISDDIREESMDAVDMQRGQLTVQSVGLTACLALLCHRLSVKDNSDTYFAEQRNDLLRNLLAEVLVKPELLVDKTNFTFTWACLGFLNEFFSFDYSSHKDIIMEFDKVLAVRRTNPEYGRKLVNYQWTNRGRK